MTFQGIIKVGIPRTNQSGLKLNIIGTFVYMQYMQLPVQLNLSTMATLGTEESTHCKEVAIVERF